MGKRSNFERVERDYYQTPFEAVKPLFPFLPAGRFSFAEPCAGDGRLVRHVREGTDRKAQCLLASDISPDCDWVSHKDALLIEEHDLENVDLIITNPPWDRRKATGQILHRLIDRFAALRPTWLLFDSDWVQTVQAKPYLERMVATVSIGRVKWIEGSTMSGKDNCQWHLFHPDARSICKVPMHFGRGIPPYPGFVDDYMGAPQLAMAA
ncbi:hypothetical protein [Phaeobacter phage MD18]|nr:hypothetical protein [Phaeobacter phage MD18]